MTLPGRNACHAGSRLFHATAVHRLIQELLGLSAPTYLHHDLIWAGMGARSRRAAATPRSHRFDRRARSHGDLARMGGIGAAHQRLSSPFRRASEVMPTKAPQDAGAGAPFHVGEIIAKGV